MSSKALEALQAAATASNETVAGFARQGERVIRVMGHDAPYELVRAFGCLPVRLTADPRLSTPLADALIGTATLSRRGRSLLEQVLGDPFDTPVLMTHADSELPQIFAALRELIRARDVAPRPIHFLDLLHMPRQSSARYNRVRIRQLAQWLRELSGREVTADAWQEAVRQSAATGDQLSRARSLRDGPAPQLRGEELLAMIASAHVLPHEEWSGLMRAGLDEARHRGALHGVRLFLAGAPQFTAANQQRLTRAGYHIVGDYQDWGDPLITGGKLAPDWMSCLSSPEWKRPLMLVRAVDRVEILNDLARRADAAYLLYLVDPEDEPSAWDAGAITHRLNGAGLRSAVWRTDAELPAHDQLFAERPLQGEVPSQPAGAAASAPGTAEGKKAAGQGRRSKKSLSSVANFGSFQRNWFQELRQQVESGAPFAVVNANSPQEIIRALDIPFVVNQWWASIAAAKQQSKRYLQLLEQHGYPTDVESYSSQGLAALFDNSVEDAPWGGLPRPDFVQAVLSTDATPRIFDHWARESGADLFCFERSVESRMEIPVEWWERLPEHWDESIESIRLDLLCDELREVIRAMEKRTGHPFDERKFVDIMRLVNEQEEYYRRTRDLIAQAHPAPVSIVDTMPATMVPQWHRGTTWARDAARDFYEEVESRFEAGECACANERLRLMWIGRGIWSDMAFYQRWQDSHGAVFIWSMYLSLAADGYIRKFEENGDPLRALAARFVTMGDELRMPTWAGAWHVREAKTHGIHAAIALSDADPFVLRALQRAGVPVLSLDLDNFNQVNKDDNIGKIDAFLDDLLIQTADHPAQ